LALRPVFALVALLYVVLLGLYSWRLKHVVIIDVLTIAAGSCCGRRRIGGDSVAVSVWLYLLTILLALFLALAKRRHDWCCWRTGPPDTGGFSRIQPVSAGPDDLGRDRIDAGGLRHLHCQPGNDRQVSRPTGWA
jgi:hypothetical protein